MKSLKPIAKTNGGGLLRKVYITEKLQNSNKKETRLKKYSYLYNLISK